MVFDKSLTLVDSKLVVGFSQLSDDAISLSKYLRIWGRRYRLCISDLFFNLGI